MSAPNTVHMLPRVQNLLLINPNFSLLTINDLKKRYQAKQENVNMQLSNHRVVHEDNFLHAQRRNEYFLLITETLSNKFMNQSLNNNI